MREASVLPGSGGRRWGCLKIPILHACPSAAVWRAASLTPSCSLPPHLALPPDRCSLLPSELQSPGFGPSRLGWPGLPGPGQEFGFSSDRLLLGAMEEWTEHSFTSSPHPTASGLCFTKLTVARSPQGFPSSRPACSSLLPLPKPWMVKVGAGSLCGVDRVGGQGSGETRRKIRERQQDRKTRMRERNKAEKRVQQGHPLHYCNVSEGDRPGDIDFGKGRVTEAASRTDVPVQRIVVLGSDGLGSLVTRS